MGIFSNLKDSFSGKNHKSPFGELGLLGDPLHYIGGDKYDNFMRKTWEYPNEYVGKAETKFNNFDRKINPLHKALDKTSFGGKAREFVENKPGDSLMAVLGAVAGGGALLGGLGGGGAGSTGVGATGAGVGPGAGTLGGLGAGGAGGGAAAGTGLAATTPADLAGLETITVTAAPTSGIGAGTLGGLGGAAGAAANAAQPQQPQQTQQEKIKDQIRRQQMQSQQKQEQQRQLDPYSGKSRELEIARQAADTAERQKKVVAALQQQGPGTYSPVAGAFV